mgnify:CR=1 FL=1
MAKEKDTYSLISVDVALEEEVVRVDAHGVHRGISSDPQDAASQLDGKQRRSDLAASSEEGCSSLNAVGSGEPVSSDGALKEPAETDSYDGSDDLEGPVPMAGMQRVIIAAVVVCLVAFIVYFAVMHG